jgi:excisionase family DNA binding protein
MGDRLEAAVTELVAALRAEFRAETSGPMPDRLLSVDDAAAALSVGRSILYNEIQAGRLRSVKVGRRRLVPGSAIRSFIASREGNADARSAPA